MGLKPDPTDLYFCQLTLRREDVIQKIQFQGADCSGRSWSPHSPVRGTRAVGDERIY